MNSPLLIDLFCGAGGAGVGYARAGFRVIGIDINPQPNYPFDFFRMDALKASLKVADASMPAPRARRTRHCPSSRARSTRTSWLPPVSDYLTLRFRTSSRSAAAPLIDPITLCGTEFGLGSGERVLKRHRLFESNIPLRRTHIGCQCKGKLIGGVYGTGGAGQMTRGYKFHPDEAREAMGIDWMSRKELSQAIPPAYTQWLGYQLMDAVMERAA